MRQEKASDPDVSFKHINVFDGLINEHKQKKAQ